MLKNINSSLLFLSCTVMGSVAAFAEGEAHEGGGGGLPQFDPTSWPSQIFWLAVFFTVLYFVFGKSIIPSLSKTIETRSSYISEHIKKAEALSAEAEALKVKADAAMAKAGHAAGAEVAEAEAKSKSKISAALTEFRNRYEDEVTTTERRIDAAKNAAMADMEQMIVSLAAQAAEKIAGIPASESGAEGVVKSLSQKTKQAA